MRVRHLVVLGGTGFVGRAFCERWVAHQGGGGGRLVVPTRRLAHGTHLRPLPSLELRECDVHDPKSLAAAVAGADAVLNLVAILHGSAADFERAHAQLPRKLVDACRAGGVRRVVHVSAIGVGPDAPSNYLRSKFAGEAVLQSSGLDLTLLRPSVIFGEHDKLLNTFAKLQALAPVVPLACADARFQPVWVDDVAAAIVRCLDDDTTVDKCFELAGPEVLTLAELVRRAGRWAGHERPVVALPGFAARAQAALMELAPGSPLMSRDNVDSMRVPNIASGKLPGFADLGIVPSPLDAVAPGYLGRDAAQGLLDRFRALR